MKNLFLNLEHNWDIQLGHGFEHKTAPKADLESDYNRLILIYPNLLNFPKYLEFQRKYAGMYLDSKTLNIDGCIHGFDSHVLHLLDDEGEPLIEKYFLIADFYDADNSVNYVFYFDYYSNEDKVYYKCYNYTNLDKFDFFASSFESFLAFFTSERLFKNIFSWKVYEDLNSDWKRWLKSIQKLVKSK